MITHPCPNIHGRFSLTAVKVREGTSNSIPHKTVEVLINHVQYLGPVSIRKTVFPGMGIPMLKIRRPVGRLIFNMGIAIPSKTVFLIETAPCWLKGSHVTPITPLKWSRITAEIIMTSSLLRQSNILLIQYIWFFWIFVINGQQPERNK